MNILGINAYHGNASAAIVCDGRLIAAVEEERFNRVKYAAGFPAQAIRYCLKKAGLTLAEIDHVAVPRNPYARLGRKIFYALRMPSFARGRAKVLLKFQGIGSAGRDVCWRLAQDPRGISPHRTSSGASREQFLLFAICTGSTAVGGWARGLRKHHVGDWQRQPHENRGRHCVSALPGSVLQRRDAVPGLPEVWRRIQSHGAGRLRADRT